MKIPILGQFSTPFGLRFNDLWAWRLERQIIRIDAAAGFLRLLSGAARLFSAAPQKLQLVYVYLQACLVLARAVLPFSGSKPPMHKNLTSFLKVVIGDLGKAAPRSTTKPIGLLDVLAVGAAACVVDGHAE